LSKLGPHSRLGEYTYIPALFGSLITSNLLQSIGTLINWRWVVDGGVSSGKLCSAQGVPFATSCVRILAFSPPHHHVGGIKQAGNVGTAVWWAMNFNGDEAALAHPLFAGRLPSLCTPSASCSCGPV